MTITVKNIIPRKQAEAVDTTQYSAVNCKTLIDKFTATNTSGAAVTMSVNLVAPAGTVGVDNRVVSAKSIAPGECYQFPEIVGQSLESGGFISTIASTGGALTLSATGREIT